MPKRLLLAVADPAVAAQAADEIFSPAGYSVTQVHDIAALRASLRRGKLPDLIFIGNPLPGGDAFKLVADLKAEYPTLPIIMLAKKATTGDLLRSMQAGLVDYIGLPLEREAALSAARRGMEQKKLWEGWLKRETGRITGSLNQRLSEMEAILRQVNDGVLVVDKANRILMVNQALRQTFGLGDADFTGMSIEQAVANPTLVEALKADGDRHEVQNKAGRVFHVRVSRIPEVGTVASLHDISYLKELDRLKGDFVNTVSHDLRSPLTAILGYVELIERAGKVNSQQSEFINRVKSSVYATTTLIDDLLKLGRVEVGALDEVTPVNMKLIVVNALAAFQPQAQEKGQTLRLRKTGDLPAVLGSRTQLSQMVDNLIGNAVKYTPPGGQIRVMLREEQNQLILHVADNGPGIPLEEQGRIFERFYRASNAPSGVSGTGLGLAIVKTIVDNHRGRIWVDSKAGGGAVFTVVLPVAKEK
ncbi:MAG: ATP-binding protein [Chloroflexi bacterium]|nr:ATP-binding protein [Chloroflexota bacterium]